MRINKINACRLQLTQHIVTYPTLTQSIRIFIISAFCLIFVRSHYVELYSLYCTVFIALYCIIQSMCQRLCASGPTVDSSGMFLVLITKKDKPRKTNLETIHSNWTNSSSKQVSRLSVILQVYLNGEALFTLQQHQQQHHQQNHHQPLSSSSSSSSISYGYDPATHRVLRRHKHPVGTITISQPPKSVNNQSSYSVVSVLLRLYSHLIL